MCYVKISGLHKITNGCNKNYPRPVTLQPENEKHAVRCCNEIDDTCTTPIPCQLASTYEEAGNICSKIGLRLCARNKRLNEVCCGTGCLIDKTTMWIADDDTGKSKTEQR